MSLVVSLIVNMGRFWGGRLCRWHWSWSWNPHTEGHAVAPT